MNFLKTKIRQFSHDDSGAFAIIFGVIAIVLIATGGSAVDFVTIQQNRSTAQISMDAAVLALQPEIYTKTAAQIKADAEAMLDESITSDDITISFRTPEIDIEAGTLLLTADISRPTVFVRLVGVDTMSATIIAEATRAKNLLEVAMVLDNSGSMSGSRISNLKSAATLAVDILSGGESNPDKVFIGLVPFTIFVNVGDQNKNEAWMDRYGQSSISWDNFDDDDNEHTSHSPADPTDRLNRFALYDSMRNTSWKGCVEARPHDSSQPSSDRLDVNDATPTSADPDTYFVPVFLPDYTGSDRSNHPSYLDDDGGSCGSGTSGLSWRERQERVCKYDGERPRSTSSSFTPNSTCHDAEILPLTNSMNDVKTAINSMSADGGTNIHQGAIWGWRVLSPTAPFDEGVAYDFGASKVMILMTDGQNFYPSNSNNNGAYWYGAYGWPYNGRLGNTSWSTSQLQGEMDNRTKMACANAKSAPSKIEIYTIGLGISSGSTNGRMLSDCATSSSHDFFPSSPSDLNDTFKKIADQLSDLRISR